MKYYTGVGSRSTPLSVLEMIEDVAYKLSLEGWILRSGGAEGSDTAFEIGIASDDLKEIYLPWDGFGNRRGKGILSLKQMGNFDKAYEIASKIHPAWDITNADTGKPVLSDAVKSLHARNIYQVLGKDLNTPSKFLICYAPLISDSVRGGTRTAYECAKRYNIPCFNLILKEDCERILKFLGR